VKPDFSGYATKAGLKCSDGRTITPEAFKHMDGKTVPLVWQHGHNEPANVLGHAVLEARPDGVYAYGYFNNTQPGQQAKTLVQHKDITSLSIYANQLVEKAKQVFHGVIREVSLVLSGANPGALIDQVAIAHADGSTDILEDEAIIYTGLELQHEDASASDQETDGAAATENDEDAGSDETDGDEEAVEHAADSTVQEIYDSLDDEQKQVVHYMIGAALEAAAAEHSDQDDEGDLAHDDDKDKEGTDSMRNVFEQGGKSVAHGATGGTDDEHVLSHDAIKGIVEEAQKSGSLKRAVEAYALQHGIENIDVLFPDAKTIDNEPEWIKRRTEWVAGVLNGTRHTPFSRIKTRAADITHEEARAKGYIKGSLKKEEFFGVTKRVTTPTTIYKKQQLDRDDMIDITDFDVVLWLKGEMRLMLEEEVARAILIGDGRDVAHEDKVKDPMGAAEGAGIRSILHDHELYVTHVNVALPAADADYNDVVEAVMRARRFYKGSGVPTFYTTTSTSVEMLLSKDAFGRRRWNNKEELANALGVSSVVDVEVMDQEADLLGIIVNLQDYSVGTDRGGDISLFDDFDIDYNQYKYLIETRLSGALTKIKAAMVVHRQAAGDVLVTPTAPAFDGTTITVPTDANVDYFVDGAAVADGATVAVAAGDTATVTATPTAGHYFATNEDDQWTFTNNA
jgi:hypothetical protein